MLTRLVVRNFKRFKELDVELGNPVVLIGPNNSGKTTILQALALWDVGVKRWVEKRGDKLPGKRPGVTINRRDLIALPVPENNLLWRNLKVRASQRAGGKFRTENVRLEIVVEGITAQGQWECGLEFDYANEESLYCRPLRRREGGERMPIPSAASAVRLAYLTPMSGLAAQEDRLDPGAIAVRIGEGRTAEVLRNLCYRLLNGDGKAGWKKLREKIAALFIGVQLEEPRYVPERGQITMAYRERTPDGRAIRMDLSSSGRGMQQTLLLLAFLYSNRGAVLLIDEPDAHLEFLRQQQIYQVLTDAAREHGNQVIAASHSEVVLGEAIGRDVVVSFVGRPHRIDSRASAHLAKALKEIPGEDYFRAEQTGWVLYLEGSTDLAILRAFARRLKHEAAEHLERPFVHYVGHEVQKARSHFFGLREGKGDLVGLGLFDRDAKLVHQPETPLRELVWKRREIENYLCHREVLLAYAEASVGSQQGPLYDTAEGERRRQVMEDCIEEIEKALAKLRRPSPWSPDIKASDDFLDPLFETFFARLGLTNLMRKTNYHVLAEYLPQELLDPEVRDVLDTISEVAAAATPAQDVV
jgi:ABC-type nitrate/sulfonate/bicarbonate transport system ATPase subunit